MSALNKSTVRRVIIPVEEAHRLGMTDSQYMNEEQLDFFRSRLLELQQALLTNVERTSGNLREMALAPDTAGRVTIEEEDANELRTRDRERTLVKQIDGAHARLDEGNYGFCGETGEPIELKRLRTRPTAQAQVGD